MSLADRLWQSLLAGGAISLDRALAYFAVAGLTWLVLHVILARYLVNRRTSDKPPAARQMAREIAYSVRSLAIYSLVAIGLVFAVLSGWTPMYLRINHYGWSWFFVSVVLCVIIHDTYFYWTHRLMHHRRLFRLMHRA